MPGRAAKEAEKEKNWCRHREDPPSSSLRRIPAAIRDTQSPSIGGTRAGDERARKSTRRMFCFHMEGEVN